MFPKQYLPVRRCILSHCSIRSSSRRRKRFVASDSHDSIEKEEFKKSLHIQATQDKKLTVMERWKKHLLLHGLDEETNQFKDDVNPETIRLLREVADSESSKMNWAILTCFITLVGVSVSIYGQVYGRELIWENMELSDDERISRIRYLANGVGNYCNIDSGTIPYLWHNLKLTEDWLTAKKIVETIYILTNMGQNKIFVDKLREVCSLEEYLLFMNDPIFYGTMTDDTQQQHSEVLEKYVSVLYHVYLKNAKEAPVLTKEIEAITIANGKRANSIHHLTTAAMLLSTYGSQSTKLKEVVESSVDANVKDPLLKKFLDDSVALLVGQNMRPLSDRIFRPLLQFFNTEYFWTLGTIAPVAFLWGMFRWNFTLLNLGMRRARLVENCFRLALQPLPWLIPFSLVKTALETSEWYAMTSSQRSTMESVTIKLIYHAIMLAGLVIYSMHHHYIIVPYLWGYWYYPYTQEIFINPAGYAAKKKKMGYNYSDICIRGKSFQKLTTEFFEKRRKRYFRSSNHQDE